MIFLSKKEQQKVNEELWEAVRIGDVVRVKILLYGADVNAKGILGNTFLHEAALLGHIEVVKLLIEKMQM